MNNEKYCKGCDQILSIDRFGNDKSSKDGKRFYCKDCNNTAYRKWYRLDEDKSREVSAKYRRKNPEKRRELWEKYKLRDKDLKLQKHYKLNISEYNMKLTSQNSVCAICFNTCSTGRYLAVDHDRACCDSLYSCGKCVRGLLCARCNRVIGWVQEDKTILKNMVKYLEDYSEKLGEST
jgi:hypothetical protein